jgi:hypothetical protein
MATIITVIAGGATAAESAAGDTVINRSPKPPRFECRGGLLLFALATLRIRLPKPA